MSKGGYKPTCFNELNEKDKIFILTYLGNGFNASNAYQVTHPNLNYNSSSSGNASATRKRLQPFIDEKLKERFEELQINADHVLMELAAMGFAEKGDEDYPAAIKIKALDLMQKQLGLQTKNQNINADVTGAVTIIDDYGTDSENK